MCAPVCAARLTPGRAARAGVVGIGSLHRDHGAQTRGGRVQGGPGLPAIAAAQDDGVADGDRDVVVVKGDGAQLDGDAGIDEGAR